MNAPTNQPAPGHCATATRDGGISIGDLADAYMAQYAGRDPSRVHQLAWWVDRLGDRAVRDSIDDDVHDAIEALASQRGRYYAGQDADRRPIMRAKKQVLFPR